MKMQNLMENWRRFLLKEDIDVSEVQQIIDSEKSPLKGRGVIAKPEDILEGNSFVLLFPEMSAKHIAERHLDGKKPGSLFNQGINLKEVAKNLLDKEPSEQSGGRVKWLGVDAGMEVGKMGVKKTSPEEVEKMKDYQMQDGAKETVKVAPSERTDTTEVSLITGELGQLSNGKKLISLITMFPGGLSIDGTTIPANRGEFAKMGLYFAVDADSEALKESKKYFKKL